MLLIRKDTEASWIKRKYRGEVIALQIIPADPEKVAEIQADNTTVTGGAEILDNKGFVKDMSDYLIKDFKGLAYQDGTKLEVTRDTKYMIANIKPLKDEQSIYDWIVEESNKLRTIADGKEDED